MPLPRFCLGLLLCLGLWLGANPLAAQDFARPEAQQAYEAGVAALKTKQASLAQAKLEQALALEPNHKAVLWELGWAFWLQQNWPQVLTHWQALARQDPHYKELPKYLPLAQDYAKLGQTTQDWTPTAPSPSPEGVIRLTAVGDLMMGSDFEGPDQLPPFKGTQIFDPVAEFLTGDIVFANLEGPLTTVPDSQKCKGKEKCWAFRTPPAYVQNLKKAGFTLVNLANNHILDFGLPGLRETQTTLNKADIAHFGPLGQPSTTLVIKGKRIAFLGTAVVSCCLHVDQIQQVSERVKALKATHDWVVVSMHAGAEGSDAGHVPPGPELYRGESRGDLRAFAHAVVDAGADLVIGHGPHALRALEQYQGKVIAYSLGNFLGYSGFSILGNLRYTMILQLEMDLQGQVKTLKVIPLVMKPFALPTPDPEARTWEMLNRLGKEDFPQSAILLDKNGEWRP